MTRLVFPDVIKKGFSTLQVLYGAIEQNQRDYEARSASKDASGATWDDYALGNSYWVSDLEGGKV